MRTMLCYIVIVIASITIYIILNYTLGCSNCSHVSYGYGDLTVCQWIVDYLDAIMMSHRRH